MKPIGIALGPDRLVAVLPGGRRLETADTADLRQAIADLKKQSGLAQARVSVAFVPPLVDVRRVRLPPMRNEERRRVLERDASRHFLGAREPQSVAIDRDSTLAAAVSARLLEDIEGAIAAAGWRLAAVVPAQVAWAASLPDGQHAIALHHVTEKVEVRQRRLSNHARLRPSDQSIQASSIDPFFAAAERVISVRALTLCSAARRAQMRRADRKFATILLAAAGACLIGAAGLDYWGLDRELAALRARRAEIASQVAVAIRMRDSLSALTGITRTLDNVVATTPRWSAFFADLADDLPRDAYLTGFEARGDTVIVTGVAGDAAGVLRGLQHITALVAVHADGPIRQDISPSGTVREHFRFAGRWGVSQ